MSSRLHDGTQAVVPGVFNHTAFISEQQIGALGQSDQSNAADWEERMDGDT